MKKLLIVLILLGLILIFSFEDVSGKTSSVDKNLTPTTKEKSIMEEVVTIYNSNHSEMENNSEVEVVDNNDSNFSISIGLDRNTTRDTNESFFVEVNNAKNIDSCNYLWKINNDRSVFGREIEISFPKGESFVTVRVICGEQEDNATIKVTAWEYFEEKTYHYNAYYGNLEYVEREIFDYKYRYVIYDDGIFSKTNFIYDDNGEVIERKKIYYKHPSENRVTKYTYNNIGDRLSVKSFNLEGKLLYLSLFKYNEKGDLISIRSGTDMEHLKEEIVVEETEEESSVVNETNEVDKEDDMKEEETILDSKGQVAYEIYDDGYTKTIYEYSYYDNGQLKEEKYKFTSEDEISTRINFYNNEGNMISRERSYKLKNNTEQCSFRTEYTYNKQGYKASSVDILLNGVCPFIDEVKREFTYDDNGNILNTHSVINGDAKNGYTTMKVVKFYTNELEEF